MNKNITIGALIIVIIALLFFFLTRSTPAEKAAVKLHKDSIIVAKDSIAKIWEIRKALVQGRADDSVRYAKRAARYEQTITFYKKKAAEVKFDDYSSKELDSVRNVIYPPGDSTYIVGGPDPLYAMPLSQARDALEAKAREPLKDAQIEENEAQIDSLEQQAVETEENFKAQVLAADLQFAQEQTISRNHQATSEYYRKKAKKATVGGWFKALTAAALGYLAGKG